MAASVHAFETSVSAGASFAEHLDRAAQSSSRPAPRPQTQPSDVRSAASDSTPQTPRTANARSSAPQPKQSAGAGSRTNTSSKAQNSDPSPVRKDAQRQPVGVRSRDSRPSDNSRNSGRRQAGDKENSANNKTSFTQAVAQSAASQSEASSTTQPAETAAQPGDASMPAALLALLQNSVTAAPAQAETPCGNAQNSTDADSATPSNLFQSLNFGTSNAAYQAALMDFQASASAAQSTSWNGTASAGVSRPSAPASSVNSLLAADQQTSAASADSEAAATGSSASASQAASENNPSVPLSVSLPQVAPAVSTDSTENPAIAAASASPAANTSLVASTGAPASQANAATSAAHAVLVANGQPQAETQPTPASLVKNFVGQHEAAKPALEGLSVAARTKPEPVATDLQQAVTSLTVVTNHSSSPALSRQVSANDSQTVTAGQDSGSQAVSAAQGSTSGWAGDSSEDSAGSDSSAQSSSASQGSNNSKSSGSTVEFLHSSAFNSDAVGGVAPAAVHAVAAGTLQSNTGFDNAAPKAPENVAQSFNSAAQEKAFAAWQSVSAQIGRVVNTAALNALQNGTEMRVQLRTDAFGSMDIRATLEGGKVGAAIGVESAEAHNALLSQLPALQQSLNERQVQLDQISVVSSNGQNGTDFGTGSGRQNGDPTPSGGYHQQASGPEQVVEPVSTPVTEAWRPATSRGRLSVQA
ncbi:MAG TPA: flagellar hook-length control protein FliK [Terriglobia bacterium]|nr:flagellar hook-length control protein FliK [Terriglobia bacterium]